MTTIDTTILENVFPGQGYHLGLKLKEDELKTLKGIIRNHWLRKIDQSYPSLTKQFEEIEIEEYHTLSHLVDHSKLWPKISRVLDNESSKIVRNFEYFKALEKFMGTFIMGDFEGLGYDEFTWRLVRPNQPLDIGPIHQDVWFTSVNGMELPKDRERVTIWFAVITEPGLSGLKVVPYTQHQEFSYKVEEKFGMQKPVIEINEEELDAQPCLMNPGDSIVFNPKMLHGGMISKGQKCRVSLECAAFLDSKIVKEIEKEFAQSGKQLSESAIP